MEDTTTVGLPETRVGGDVRAVFWDDFVGQDDIKRRLEVRISAALAAERPLDHLILTAPPGYGKTTLANMVAFKLGHAFHPFVAPVSLSAIRDVLLECEGDPVVIFIDEVHLATKREQEDLLTLLEEGFLQVGGERVYHPNVTIIAGTTARDKVIPALWDRFPLKPVFVDYDADEMGRIVAGMADRLGVVVDEAKCVRLGRATGGTPRNARALVSAARDLVESGHDASVESILDLAGVDPDGLDDDHKEYLRVLVQSNRGSLGLNPLAARLRIRTTVVEQMERLLLDLGYVELGMTGREITEAGRKRAKTL